MAAQQNDAGREPENNPENKRKQNPLVQADRYMGIAFILPVSIFVGYGIGWFLDHRFGTKYWTMVFLLIGIVAGFVEMIREITRER